MKILLTGQPHSGKTTLLRKVVAATQQKQGFITEEIIRNEQRSGFRLISSDGRTTVLADVEHKSGFQVSRYFVDIDALEGFIEPSHSPLADKLLYIDEIGEMQLASESFRQLVLNYLNAENDFIGTLTSVYSDEFVEQLKLRDDIERIEVTIDNRDKFLKELSSRLSA